MHNSRTENGKNKLIDGMVDVRFLFKQMPRSRSLTRSWLVEIKTDRALMTGSPQHSLHATVPRSAVWRVACELNPCTQSLRMGDERFLSNVFIRFFIFITFFTFFNVFYFFSERCYIYGRHEYQLPKCSSDLHQRSYIVHSLYSLISFCQSHFIQSIPWF